MKSVMTHDFSNAPTIQAPRSQFDRSYGHKFTMDAGWLVPFYVDDVLPGDTFNMNTTAIARLSTPLFPFMDNMYLDTHFFFVPTRLVWDNAKRFFGEQINPTDTIDYALPTFTSFIPTEQSLSDYMELPIGTAMTPVSLYHRAYNLIYNEWFRDQNLQDSVVVDTGDGPDDIANYVLKRRGKRHDYFTSALPWPQKGDAVNLPLGTYAPVVEDPNQLFIRFNSGSVSSGILQHGNNSSNVELNTTGTGVGALQFDGANTGLRTDLTSATSATISDLREAFQVQKLLERDARSGTRYSELVRNHFGVNFYDVSVRPEFLGGGSTPIKSTPVANTFGSAVSSSYVGELGAFATAGLTGHGFTKSFVEHGIVIGIMSVRADLTYQQGIPRRYLKSTRYDYYWPSLAHLGEQEITNAEIYYQNTADDDLVFGYQERYAEYRYKNSHISGAFRSTAAAPLDAWHLSQEFSALPTLGPTFIEENPPIDRIIAVPSEPHLIVDTYNSLKCARPMPVYGVPGLIDHF